MKAPAFLSRWLKSNGNGVQNGPAQHVADPILSERNDVLDAMPFSKPKRPPVVLEEERADCQGPASCRKCGAELELVCPNGHGGADEVLADLAAPKKRAPAPTGEETVTLKCSVTGCDAQPVPWKGRGRKPTRCEKHLTKHPEQKRSA